MRPGSLRLSQPAYTPVICNSEVTHHISTTQTYTHSWQTNVKKKSSSILSLFSICSCALACHVWAWKYKQILKFSLSPSLTFMAPFPVEQQKTDKSVLITGESGERCHDVTNCKQIQWNKSLFVSTHWKVDRERDHRRGCNFPSDRVCVDVCEGGRTRRLVTPTS